MRTGLKLFAALALSLATSTATTQTYLAPPQPANLSPLFTGASPQELIRRADTGTQIERGRDPAGELEEHRKLERALRALGAQRPGTVDAYVVSIALDSDHVFGREARAAGEVLGRRYDAAGRTLVLAGSDGSGPSALPRGTPTSLAVALARVAELMDESEDALILYTTSHGAPFGLYYNDGDSGFGAVSPLRLREMLERLGIHNRLLILSACYSGVFVPMLRSDTTAIVTAASYDRPSFGCDAENDWTFFGDAMVNHALRHPQPLPAAFAQANALVSAWETRLEVLPSQPQISIGPAVARWLGPLERRMPREASRPVGRPAVETSAAAAGR